MSVKLGKLSRSVSIIGVGCTPFTDIMTNPKTNGLTEGELFGWAALEAMKDAGVEAKDVDMYFHGQVPRSNSRTTLPRTRRLRTGSACAVRQRCITQKHVAPGTLPWISR